MVTSAVMQMAMQDAYPRCITNVWPTHVKGKNKSLVGCQYTYLKTYWMTTEIVFIPESESQPTHIWGLSALPKVYNTLEVIL